DGPGLPRVHAELAQSRREAVSTRERVEEGAGHAQRGTRAHSVHAARLAHVAYAGHVRRHVRRLYRLEARHDRRKHAAGVSRRAAAADSRRPTGRRATLALVRLFGHRDRELVATKPRLRELFDRGVRGVAIGEEGSGVRRHGVIPVGFVTSRIATRAPDAACYFIPASAD